MIIKTNRLIIRKFAEDDLPDFEKLLNIVEVPGWMMQRKRSADFLAWQISNYTQMDIIGGTVCFGIFCKENGNIFGAVAAEKHDDLGETEIAYNLLPSARGFGYAAEAAGAVTSWALANYNIPYIIGTCAVDNIASQKVLERCGYIFIDERSLPVHITNQTYKFKYYRRYRDTEGFTCRECF